MTRLKIIILFAIALILTSCDEVDEPYGNQVEIEAPTELTKKAVIFEFTGIHCTNCPAGHEAIEQIDSVYHGHIIPISVHAGFFAEPYPGEPDFRTPFGDKIFTDLGLSSTPAASIASLNENDAISGAPTSWQGEVGSVIPDYTDFIITPDIQLQDSTLQARYVITERVEAQNPLRFYALIIEDHIEGPQAGSDINPYDHRHVLRKCINDISGTSVSFTDGVDELSFTAILDATWQTENLYVVGIIVDQNTKEIYTGEQVKLITE